MHQVDRQCGVARFRLLDGPWATLIVRELLHGPRRPGGAERERTFT